jgi:DNA-binding MarR family transcriptional regulator
MKQKMKQEMELKDTELVDFFDQIAIIRKLPIMNILSKTFREMNLSEEQMMALMKIRLAPDGAFVSTVAKRMYIDKPKASRLVDSLVEVGLAERTYGKLADRRKIQLQVTQKGMDLMQQMADEMVQAAKELLKDRGENMKRLTEYLKDFNNTMVSLMDSMNNK